MMLCFNAGQLISLGQGGSTKTNKNIHYQAQFEPGESDQMARAQPSAARQSYHALGFSTT